MSENMASPRCQKWAPLDIDLTRSKNPRLMACRFDGKLPKPCKNALLIKARLPIRADMGRLHTLGATWRSWGKTMKFSYWLLMPFVVLAACSDTDDNSSSVQDSPADMSSVSSDATEASDPLDRLRANIGSWLGGQMTFQEALPDWVSYIEPARIVGPLHLVGSKGLSSFFIPTPDGHILIDAPLPQHAPVILDHIRTLGYDPADIKYLLNTHAHWDHFGGLSHIKAATGAKMIASAADRPLLEAGVDRSHIDPVYKVPGVAVDQIIEDGETVQLGGVQLTAAILPGHSPGCTSWSMQAEEAGETFDILIFCSMTVSPLGLPNDQETFDVLVTNYRSSFEKARGWRPDVFLSNHAEFYHPGSKLEKLANGDPFAFVDREEFPAFLERMENDFNGALASRATKKDGTK